MDPRDLDPNNPIPAIARGIPRGRKLPQSSNKYALLDWTVHRLFPSWLITAVGLLCAALLAALLVWLFA